MQEAVSQSVGEIGQRAATPPQRGAAGAAGSSPAVSWTVAPAGFDLSPPPGSGLAGDLQAVGQAAGGLAAKLGLANVVLPVTVGAKPDFQRVSASLRAMLEGVRVAGVACPQIDIDIPFTALLSSRPDAAASLDKFFGVVAGSGIQRIKCRPAVYVSSADGPFGQDVRAQIRLLRAEIEASLVFVRRHGVKLLYSAPEPGSIGCAVWDILAALEGLDPAAIGLSLNVAQMTCEGPEGIWQVNLRASQPFWAEFVLHDAILAARDDGGPSQEWVPAGRGLVQWAKLFELIDAGGFVGSFTMPVLRSNKMPSGESVTEVTNEESEYVDLKNIEGELSFIRNLHVGAYRTN